MKEFLVVTSGLLASTWMIYGQPTISNQPKDYFISLGANVTQDVTATGVGPLTYLWHFDGFRLPEATNHNLVLTNIQLANSGQYSVVVNDSSGSTTSRVAVVKVDSRFTKITTGSIATDRSRCWGCGWGDYDNDGFVDLVVGVTGRSLLYHNNADGSFSKITNSPIVTIESNGSEPIWGDYDNDGFLDLFMPDSAPYRNRLYRNNGDSTFTRITTGALESVTEGSYSAAWGDYDNDGFLDLVLSKYGAPKSLYRNNRNGAFTKMTQSQVGPLVGDSGSAITSVWVDYDDDGDLDLLFTQEDEPNHLYQHNGDGTFTLVPPTQFGLKSTSSMGAAWEDFHNRGLLDLFIVNGRTAFRENDFYFRNNGDGTFTALTSNEVGSVVADASPGYGCAAADYDNDGYLDLFVTNPGLGFPGPPETNLLHHNNGDGTFSRVSVGSLTSDSANSAPCAWGDYDNDGFMDLYVGNGAMGGFGGLQASFLYHNNGNSNHWISLKLVGTVSNRSAVGAKVRVKATIRGKTMWQLRNVTSAGFFYAQNDARPHFGLGDATVAETIRIEWPSGILQVLQNVPVNQILTVTEPPRLEPTVTLSNGLAELKVKSWKGFGYGIEASTNLVNWTRLTTLTNLTGALQFQDPNGLNRSRRFYRIAVP